MIRHEDHSAPAIRQMIRNRKISFAGHLPARIYGTLDCSSGKRIKKENRVFFKTETDAIASRFRPCGHCLKSRYKQWKSENDQLNVHRF